MEFIQELQILYNESLSKQDAKLALDAKLQELSMEQIQGILSLDESNFQPGLAANIRFTILACALHYQAPTFSTSNTYQANIELAQWFINFGNSGVGHFHEAVMNFIQDIIGILISANCHQSNTVPLEFMRIAIAENINPIFGSSCIIAVLKKLNESKIKDDITNFKLFGLEILIDRCGAMLQDQNLFESACKLFNASILLSKDEKNDDTVICSKAISDKIFSPFIDGLLQVASVSNNPEAVFSVANLARFAKNTPAFLAPTEQDSLMNYASFLQRLMQFTVENAQHIPSQPRPWSVLVKVIMSNLTGNELVRINPGVTSAFLSTAAEATNGLMHPDHIEPLLTLFKGWKAIHTTASIRGGETPATPLIFQIEATLYQTYLDFLLTFVTSCDDLNTVSIFRPQIGIPENIPPIVSLYKSAGENGWAILNDRFSKAISSGNTKAVALLVYASAAIVQTRCDLENICKLVSNVMDQTSSRYGEEGYLEIALITFIDACQQLSNSMQPIQLPPILYQNFVKRLVASLGNYGGIQCIAEGAVAVISKMLKFLAGAATDSSLAIISNLLEIQFPCMQSKENKRARVDYWCGVFSTVLKIGNTEILDKMEASIQAMGTQSDQALAMWGYALDLLGCSNACLTDTQYDTLFDWLLPEKTNLLTQAIQGGCDIDTSIAILKFWESFTQNNNQKRIIFSNYSANGIILFKSVTECVVPFLQNLASAELEDDDRARGLRHAINVFSNMLLGNYVMFDAFEIYGDPSLQQLIAAVLQVLSAWPAELIQNYPKLMSAIARFFQAITDSNCDFALKSGALGFIIQLSSMFLICMVDFQPVMQTIRNILVFSSTVDIGKELAEGVHNLLVLSLKKCFNGKLQAARMHLALYPCELAKGALAQFIGEVMQLNQSIDPSNQQRLATAADNYIKEPTQAKLSELSKTARSLAVSFPI